MVGPAHRSRHPLPRSRGARGVDPRRPATTCSADGSSALPDRGDERSAPGRADALRWRDVDWAARVVRVRRSYARGEFTHAEEPALGCARSRCPIASRPSSSATSALALSGRRRPRLRPSATGRPYDASRMRKRFKEALSGGAPTAALPRSPPHVRNADGGGGRTDADAAGVDGPPRLQDGREVYADFAPIRRRAAVWAERAFGSATPELVVVEPQEPPGRRLVVILSAARVGSRPLVARRRWRVPAQVVASGVAKLVV